MHFSQQDLLAHSLSPLFNLIPLTIVKDHSNVCLGIKNFDSLNNETDIIESIHVPDISNTENTNIHNISPEIKRQIEINYFKPLSWHIDLLNGLNYQFTDNKVKYYIEVIRNQNFPKNNIYVPNIFNYQSKISDNANELPALFVW